MNKNRIDMKTGNWHGCTATVLYENRNTAVFLIGEFNPNDLDSIIDNLNNGDGLLWADFGYNVQSVSKEEWDKQQNKM